MSESSISLRNIEKQLGDFRLGPLSLDIPQGYVTAIVGPNGAGKSTLFRMLTHLLHPDKGELAIQGDTYDQSDIRIKQRIACVSEMQEWLEGGMTGAQVANYIRPFYDGWNQSEYSRLMHKFQVSAHKKLRYMSKGMVQKLSFLLSLSQGPKLLLLDEPSSGLDPLAWHDMLDEIHDFMEKGEHTVLIATHIIEEVRRIADYVLFMYDGRIIGHYEKDQLLEDWKEIWIAEETHTDLGSLQGVVGVEAGGRMITSCFAQTASELSSRNIRIIRSQSINLDEILRYVIKQAN